MTDARLFDIEREGDTAIVTAESNLGELEDLASGGKDVYDFLNDESLKNLVIDFHKTDYFGSSAIVFFVHLWKIIGKRGGRMVFCNLSEHEKEILEITNLDTQWAVCASREEALQLVI